MRNVSVKATSFQEWRHIARHLLLANVAPYEIQWDCAATPDLLDSLGTSNALLPSPSSSRASASLSVNRHLISTLQTAACYRCADRWPFLYKVLWRWHHGEKVVLSPADADGKRLQAMVKTIRREIHKMNAFVRFREYADAALYNNAPRFVAWFEPSHDVLPPVAKHFAKRMGQTPWMIATPQGSAYWDGAKLYLDDTPSLQSKLDIANIEDHNESLWLVYYRSIFNPARLNRKAMELEMPVRYWKNLPEGKLIPQLISAATAGAQRVAQTNEVGLRKGATIQIEASRAQPKRAPVTLLQECRQCDLWRHATQVVSGTGPATARIMLVGEQPSDQEDIEGKPFVGSAGQLLGQALEQAGLDRGALYLTNVVKHFKWEPRGKQRLAQAPQPHEVQACMHWLKKEIDQQQPVVIVALGARTLQALLPASSTPLASLLGKQLVYGRSRRILTYLVPTYHPTKILRLSNKEARENAFAQLVTHLKMVRSMVQSMNCLLIEP